MLKKILTIPNYCGKRATNIIDGTCLLVKVSIITIFVKTMWVNNLHILFVT